MHAQIVLFDGFGPLDVIAPYEVLYAGGTASGLDLALDGDQLTWKQAVTKRRTILAATEHRP